MLVFKCIGVQKLGLNKADFLKGTDNHEEFPPFTDKKKSLKRWGDLTDCNRAN